MRNPSLPADRQAGFTLLELIVAMAVLGMVLGMLGMRGPARHERLDAMAAARELAGSLQAARSRAIAQNRMVVVSLGASSYSLDGEAARPLPAAISADPRSVAFAGNGGSSGGEVVLQAGTRRQTVRIEWLTGRVTVAEAR